MSLYTFCWCVELNDIIIVIGKMELHKTYNLRNVTVKSYNGKKYLSCSHTFDYSGAPNYGKVKDPFSVLGGMSYGVVTGEIMSVLSMDTFQCCLSCNSKVETVSGGIGRCKRCSAQSSLQGVQKAVVLTL